MIISLLCVERLRAVNAEHQSNQTRHTDAAHVGRHGCSRIDDCPLRHSRPGIFPAPVTTGFPPLDRLAKISHYGFYVIILLMYSSGFSTEIISGLNHIVFERNGHPLPKTFAVYPTFQVHAVLAGLLAVLVAGHISRNALSPVRAEGRPLPSHVVRPAHDCSRRQSAGAGFRMSQVILLVLADRCRGLRRATRGDPAPSGRAAPGGQIAYWVFTTLVAYELTAGAWWDLLDIKFIRLLLGRLGYPPYFTYIEGAPRMLFVLAVLLPRLPRLKEWAYAWTFFTYMERSRYLNAWCVTGYGCGQRCSAASCWFPGYCVRLRGSGNLQPTSRPSAVAWSVPLIITAAMLAVAYINVPTGNFRGRAQRHCRAREASPHRSFRRNPTATPATLAGRAGLSAAGSLLGRGDLVRNGRRRLEFSGQIDFPDG